MITRLFSCMSNILDINIATLSGCNDIIVVKQPDGTLKSTPFHVRFGKYKILQSRETEVSIIVNNDPISISMFLDEAGEAYFKVDDSAYNKQRSAFEASKNPPSQTLSALPQKQCFMSNVCQSGSQEFDCTTVRICSGHDDKGSIVPTKTLRPTSDQLMSFGLLPGNNFIQFVVYSTIMGTQILKCSLYLWDTTVRIIVSDIDGTITRSDILGQVSPIFRKDWSHTGVAALLSACRNNHYQVLYLSSRSIGQTDTTRDYLFGLRQGVNHERLPDGPLFLNPNRLFSAFHTEVIERKPYIFKTVALRDLRALFPGSCNPYYAGFGNRETDRVAYTCVGIPSSRIYIINRKGIIYNNNAQYSVKSYASLHNLMDRTFPKLVDVSELVPATSLSHKRINAAILYGPACPVGSRHSVPRLSGCCFCLRTSHTAAHEFSSQCSVVGEHV